MAIQSESKRKPHVAKEFSKGANSLSESLEFIADRYSRLYIFRDVFFPNFEIYITRKWSVKLSLERNLGSGLIDGRHWNVSLWTDT